MPTVGPHLYGSGYCLSRSWAAVRTLYRYQHLNGPQKGCVLLRACHLPSTIRGIEFKSITATRTIHGMAQRRSQYLYLSDVVQPSSNQVVTKLRSRTRSAVLLPGRHFVNSAVGTRTRNTLRRRDGSPSKRLHRFSLTINDSNKPGKLLSLKTQLPRKNRWVRTQFWHAKGRGMRETRGRRFPEPRDTPGQTSFATHRFAKNSSTLPRGKERSSA